MPAIDPRVETAVTSVRPSEDRRTIGALASVTLSSRTASGYGSVNPTSATGPRCSCNAMPALRWRTASTGPAAARASKCMLSSRLPLSRARAARCQ